MRADSPAWQTHRPMEPVLQTLETYYDSVPRPRSDVEEIGPFTLFVARAGWPYYARPRLGGAAPSGGIASVTEAVRRVLDRQRELGVPLAFEWVGETTPWLLAPAEAAGMTVEQCPLLVLDEEPRGSAGSSGDGVVRMLSASDGRDLALSRAAVSVGFDVGGTSIGDAGIAERDARAGEGYATVDETLLARLRSGELRQAACYAVEEPALGPVGGGGHSPVAGVTEIAGVAVLPAYRRRGLAGELTRVLARDALALGVTTVFCSAQSDEVARVYQRVGFRRVATACIASAT